MLHIDDGCKHGDMKKRTLGDVTTINLTHLKSGVSVDGGETYALNVIPTEAIAGFDVRISPHLDILSFKVSSNTIDIEGFMCFLFVGNAGRMVC